MTETFRAALRHPRFWVRLGLLWTIIITAACFLPSLPMTGISGVDKVQHSLAFMGLAFWFGAVYPPGRHIRVALLLTGLGLAIEVGQAQTGHRNGSILDFAADTVGVLAGIALARTRLACVLRYFEARVIPARN